MGSVRCMSMVITMLLGSWNRGSDWGVAYKQGPLLLHSQFQPANHHFLRMVRSSLCTSIWWPQQTEQPWLSMVDTLPLKGTVLQYRLHIHILTFVVHHHQLKVVIMGLCIQLASGVRVREGWRVPSLPLHTHILHILNKMFQPLS